MLYESMTIDELERRVYIEPENQEAMAALIERVCVRRDGEIEELHENIACLKDELDEANDEIKILTSGYA